MAKAKTPVEETGKKIRVNLFIDSILFSKLDHIAGMNFAINKSKATRTDIVNEGLSEYVAKWEKKNGTISVK